MTFFRRIGRLQNDDLDTIVSLCGGVMVLAAVFFISGGLGPPGFLAPDGASLTAASELGGESAATLPKFTDASSLAGLQGYGAGTTGGLGGVHYIVTNPADYDPSIPGSAIPGTLRYGVDMIGKCGEIGICPTGATSTPVWISSGIPLSQPVNILERVRPNGTTYSLPLDMPSNSTIEGPITIASKYYAIDVFDNSNVILRKIRFARILGAVDTAGLSCDKNSVQHLGCGVPLLVESQLKAIDHIWVDHNEFANCGEKCFAIFVQGPLPKDGSRLPPADNITISNNSFKDSFYALLMGELGTVGNNLRPPLGTMRISIYGNLFSNIFLRSPRVAGAFQVHLFNNAVLNWVDLGNKGNCEYGRGSDVSGGGELLAENNYYYAPGGNASFGHLDLCKHAIENMDLLSNPPESIDLGWGHIHQTGNVFLNGALCVLASSSTTFVSCVQDNVFTPPYAYTLLTAQQAYASVLANAGINPGGVLPLLYISATPISVKAGQSSTVSWNSAGVASCSVTYGSGTSFATGTSGSRSTGELPSNRTYTLSCGSNKKTVTISVIPIPTLSITAPDASALEGSGSKDTGTYLITRTSPTAEQLAVSVSVSGTATRDSDYVLTQSGIAVGDKQTAYIPAGATSTTILLTTKQDTLKEGTETAVITLVKTADYAIGPSSKATVSILDDEPK